DVRFQPWEHYEDVPAAREAAGGGGGASAFVTVQRGCDYRCTFCIVPMTRGPERSRKLADVVRGVEGLVARGTTEVPLLGQTVNSYRHGDHAFEATVSLVREVRLDDAYTFKYSLRDGTPAVKLKDRVPEAVAGERLERLIAVVRRVARAKNVALVGTTHEVLVEGKAKRGGLLQARTRGNKVALLDGPDE